MRKYLLILLLTLLFSCKDDKKPIQPSGTNCIPTELDANLIAFYPFKNGSLLDEKNNNDLTNINSAQVAEDRDGNSTCAYRFSRNSASYLKMQNPEFLDGLDDMSISAWYYHEVDNDGTYEVLVGRDSLGACPDKYGQWSLGLYDGNRAVFGKLNSVWDGLGDYSIKKWFHVVATYNKVDHRIRIYKNGVFSEEKTGIAKCGSSVCSNDIGDFIIGKFFNGIIDDVAIFNKELDLDEVKKLYELEPCCFSNE